LFFYRKRQIAELQNKMMTLREDVGKKNDILSQRIVEMESAKRKFEEELKKFNSKNVILKFYKMVKINFFSQIRRNTQYIQPHQDLFRILMENNYIKGKKNQSFIDIFQNANSLLKICFFNELLKKGGFFIFSFL